MKTIHSTLLALFCISGLALASPIVVLEGPLDESETVDAEFAVDGDQGRAWINVMEVDWQFEPAANTVRRSVEGLSYDSRAKQVLYRSGDRRVVCGEATGVGVLGIGIRPTGDCSLKVSYDERTVDVGSGPRKQAFFKVTLDPGTR